MMISQLVTLLENSDAHPSTTQNVSDVYWCLLMFIDVYSVNHAQSAGLFSEGHNQADKIYRWGS